MLKKSEDPRQLGQTKQERQLRGDSERIEEHYGKSKMTAKERLERLLDPESFVELEPLAVHQCTDFGMDTRKIPGDGVVVGYGTIESRLVYVFAHDFTAFGGSVGEIFAKKVCRVIDMAIKSGTPIIGLIDSAGVRVQEGLSSLAGCGEISFRSMAASGVVPQILAVMGPCAGGVAHSAAIADFLLMVEGNSCLFATSPGVIRSTMGQDISAEALGGALVHSQSSGVAHLLVKDDAECLRQVRKLLSYIPSNNLEEPPRSRLNDGPDRTDAMLDNVIPENQNQHYDMKQVIFSVVDDHDFFEIHSLWAQNIVVGLARLYGGTVGIVGNQPEVLEGMIDIYASAKAARFIRFCDAFNIPLVTFVDTPGFLPDKNQEHEGIVRHASKLLYAYSEATVPKITLITRKAYGMAYVVMCSKHVRSDINYAWPTAEIAVMGPEGAVETIFGRELAEAENRESRKSELTVEYKKRFCNPTIAAEKGYIDDVIIPHETRPKIIRALQALSSKREGRPPKKHGNIPL